RRLRGPGGAACPPARRGTSGRGSRRGRSHPLWGGDSQNPQTRRDRPLGEQAERQASVLDSLALCADHLAVSIEGVKVGRDRGRVGADAVWGAALGGLTHLLGELEQALDQRLLR